MTRLRAFGVIVAVSTATAGFAAVQNTGARGGSISAAKALWLNLAILSFIALPALAWSDRRIPTPMRRCFAALAGSFTARALVELPVLYLTEAWNCAIGAAHDVATAGAVASLWLVARRDGPRADPATSGLVALGIALCLVEAAFAQAFCAVADPATSWFANADPRFDGINAATWAVVACAYPALLSLVWRISAHPLLPRARTSPQPPG